MPCGQIYDTDSSESIQNAGQGNIPNFCERTYIYIYVWCAVDVSVKIDTKRCWLILSAHEQKKHGKEYDREALIEEMGGIGLAPIFSWEGWHRPPSWLWPGAPPLLPGRDCHLPRDGQPAALR